MQVPRSPVITRSRKQRENQKPQGILPGARAAQTAPANIPGSSEAPLGSRKKAVVAPQERSRRGRPVLEEKTGSQTSLPRTRQTSRAADSSSGGGNGGQVRQEAPLLDSEAKRESHPQAKSKPRKNLCYVNVPPPPKRALRRRPVGEAITQAVVPVATESPPDMLPLPNRSPSPYAASAESPPDCDVYLSQRERPSDDAGIITPLDSSQPPDSSYSGGLVTLFIILFIGTTWGLLYYHIDPDTGYSRLLAFPLQLGY
ncbi:hypothetical protein BKA93DRAFT_578709 [Sparassis latifolia]